MWWSEDLTSAHSKHICNILSKHDVYRDQLANMLQKAHIHLNEPLSGEEPSARISLLSPTGKSTSSKSRVCIKTKRSSCLPETASHGTRQLGKEKGKLGNTSVTW
jgi:hypothetical protein